MKFRRSNQRDRGLALVTGAAANIGQSIAKRLAGDGYQVIAVDSDEQALSVLDVGVTHKIVEDLGAVDPAGWASDLVAKFGPIETVVHNAGFGTSHRALELTADVYDKVLGVNVRFPILSSVVFAQALIGADQSGSFVFITSLHSHVRRGNPHYSMSKAALTAGMREFAYDLAPHNIIVNAVAPGWTSTEKAHLKMAQQKSYGPDRPNHPDEIADAVSFLLSSSGVVGEVINVDLGLSLHSWSDIGD